MLFFKQARWGVVDIEENSFTVDQTSKHVSTESLRAVRARMEARLPALSLKPLSGRTLYPTKQEFVNPIQYITSRRGEIANHGGICRILPPEGWNCPFALETDTLEIRTQPQHINRLNDDQGVKRRKKKKRKRIMNDDRETGEDDDAEVDETTPTSRTLEYSSFLDTAKRVRVNWEKQLVASGDSNTRSMHWEHIYWDIVQGKFGDVWVEYGKDIPAITCGGGFPQSYSSTHRLRHDSSPVDSDFQDHSFYTETEWNISNIPFAKGNVLGLDPHSSTSSSHFLHFGMQWTTDTWHTTDMFLHAMNYLHLGDAKVWYGISPQFYEELLEVLGQQNSSPTACRMISPVWLLNQGIPVHRLVQNPGEFVVVLPQTQHAAFSLGFNCSESIHFSPMNWLPPVKMYDSMAGDTSSPLCLERLIWKLSEYCINPERKQQEQDVSTLLSYISLCAEKEEAMRAQCREDGVSFMVKLPETTIPDGRCVECSRLLYLSCVVCHCQSNVSQKRSCALHHRKLCGCNPANKCLIVYVDSSQFKQRIRTLQRMCQHLS